MAFKQTLSGGFFRNLRQETRTRISFLCNTIGISKLELMDFEHERAYPDKETELKLLNFFEKEIRHQVSINGAEKRLIMLAEGIKIRKSYIQ